MAVTANSIITPQSIRSQQCIHTAQQNTWPPTTSPTNTTVLFTAGANGSRITRITAIPHETTGAAGVLQLYRSVGSSGIKYLFKTAAITNDTVSGTDAPIEIDFGYSEDNPLLMKASEELYVAHSLSSKAVCFNAEGADY